MKSYADAIATYKKFEHDYGGGVIGLLSSQRLFIAELFGKDLTEVERDVLA